MIGSSCDCAEPNYCRHNMHAVYSTVSSPRLVHRHSDCVFIVDLDEVFVGLRTENRAVEKIARLERRGGALLMMSRTNQGKLAQWSNLEN